MKNQASSIKKVFLYWNGFSYQIFHPIAQTLIRNNFIVYLIENPFTVEDDNVRLFSEFNEHKKPSLIRSRRIFLKVPLTYFFDIFWPMNKLKTDIAISFSPHLTLRNIALKKLGFVKVVIQWNIDYSPVRFKNSLLQKIYLYIDRFGVINSDYQIDLTQKAKISRIEAHNLVHSDKNLVVPVGTCFKSVPDFEKSRTLNLVFVGNFNQTQDVEILLKCMKSTRIESLNIKLHVAGSGPSFDYLKIKYNNPNITFYGNLDQNQIDSLLATCHVGLAPYLDDPNSFSRFSDPSKLKKYSEFGLPIIMTDVPHNSKSLKEAGVALVGKCELDFFLTSIEKLNGNLPLLKVMSENSKQFCLSNSWDEVLKPFINALEEVSRKK